MTLLASRKEPTSPTAPGRTQRTRIVVTALLALALLLVIVIAGTFGGEAAATTGLTDKNLPPSAQYWFGTDRLGRDLFWRTMVGLRLSIGVGIAAALASGAIAVLLAGVALLGGRIGAAVVSWLVDLLLALPHLVLLILLSFALGGGTEAVLVAIALTHWPRLTRVLIAVGRASLAGEYVTVSRRLGASTWFLARRHLAGSLVPHLSIGTILMFPHAVLHEAAMSFLGLGVDPGLPAVGILLAESMRSLSAGHWWLAVLPGCALLIVVLAVDALGRGLRRLTDPRSHHL